MIDKTEGWLCSLLWRVVRVVIWRSAKPFTQVRILYSPHPVKDKGVSPGIELGKWFDSTFYCGEIR